MILYKKKTQPIFRYTLAIIVLTLGLTLTVVDVYGLQIPFGQNTGKLYNDYVKKKIDTIDDSVRGTVMIDQQTDLYNNQDKSTDTIPTSVPEPSTIILLASGLGLLRMTHRKKS